MCPYQRVHSQFGKEGKKQAVAMYQRSADIAVLAYGYEHPVSVAALTELEAGFDTPRAAPSRHCCLCFIITARTQYTLHGFEHVQLKSVGNMVARV